MIALEDYFRRLPPLGGFSVKQFIEESSKIRKSIFDAVPQLLINLDIMFYARGRSVKFQEPFLNEQRLK